VLNPTPDLPTPHGVTVREWEDANTPHAFRYFEGTHWFIERTDRWSHEPIEVYMAGLQRPDGSIEPQIVVHEMHADYPITSIATARELVRCLTAAIGEWESLR
jgi:hypothetical protein